jgi:callose synthase
MATAIVSCAWSSLIMCTRAKLYVHAFMAHAIDTLYNCSNGLHSTVQDDNVRNQVEHIMGLVANHRRFTESGPTSLSNITSSGTLPTVNALYGYHRTGVHSLHRKIFENYRGWCKNLNVAPKFMPVLGGSSAEETAEVQAKMSDIMLFMCIWGESANLRHMPECLCFLYHKMMQEFLVHRGAGEGSSLYAGYFLDHVVTPIWDVVLKHHKVKGDHIKVGTRYTVTQFRL